MNITTASDTTYRQLGCAHSITKPINFRLSTADDVTGLYITLS
jgi:hypothetical protein